MSNPYVPYPQPGQQPVVVPAYGIPVVQQQQLVFQFDGGAATFVGIQLLSLLLTFFTLGIAAPWAMAMEYRWVANHTIINGRRVEFTGTGLGLFGNWIKWLLLMIITLGIYSFWVIPRLWKWRIENQRVL